MGQNREPKLAAGKGSGSDVAVYDRRVSELFTARIGPVKDIPTPRTEPFSSAGASESLAISSGNTDPGALFTTDPQYRANISGNTGASKEIPTSPVFAADGGGPQNRKRKRRKDEWDIEGKYMQRIAEEESRSAGRNLAESSNKHRKLHGTSKWLEEGTSANDGGTKALDTEPNSLKVDSQVDMEVPQHESLTASGDAVDLDKAARTVFLANVTTSCIKSKAAKKTLLGHLASFCPLLPVTDLSHKIDSLRFRSTPFASGVGPKKAAYAKREVMDSTSKNTNAYAVYTTPLAAREAVKRLNGSVVLDRHLLVDSVAHPRKTDNRRCVFVGNLGFVDDESRINAAKAASEDKKPRKLREPSDVEEGLWRQFGEAGQVESVRVVRDGTTRVGKGFAYVQFQDENAVEKALLYNDKKFPPLLPRLLRVTRAKKMTRAATRNPGPGGVGQATSTSSKARYAPRVDPVARSMSGRAAKLFGRAAAAHLKDKGGPYRAPVIKGSGGVSKAPEQVIFEGHRASSKFSRGTKAGGSEKKRGKPQTRSGRRGAEFKAKGGKKAGTRK
ncbi:MAG: hypothetical protein LQ345_004253 [Seirophora villosa]|nr:MAG: hypothetical protein LQ345_004253 [Seirophora villosa]